MELLDRDRLDLLARDLADAATQVRTLTDGVRAAAASTCWQSPAARACAATLESLLVGGLHLAERLDGTASAVRSHSQRAWLVAEQALDTARSAEHRAAAVAERLVRW